MGNRRRESFEISTSDVPEHKLSRITKIIHRRFCVDMVGSKCPPPAKPPPPKLRFYQKDLDPDETYTLDEYIAFLKKKPGGALLGYGPKRRSPWDLHNIKECCHIFIELDGVVNWRFTQKGPAVTTVENHGGHYRHLRHYDSNLKIIDSWEDCPKADCRLISFALWSREEGETRHKFNFHVEMTPIKKEEFSMEIIFDPDVENPGGTGIKPP